MKITQDIGPGQTQAFHAGQAGQYFILREASQSVLLKGDTLRPVELERGDVVDVSRFEQLALSNPHSTSVHVEYQVADVEVRIRNASTAIDGSLTVHDIRTPITIDRIQEPLDIQVHIPDVKVTDIDVNIPDVQVDFPASMAINNLPAIQRVEVTNPPQEHAPELHALPRVVIGADHNISANPHRKGVIAIAPDTNTGVIMVAGFVPIHPGGQATLPACNALSVSGQDGDMLHVGEIR
ncbi:hypothetical protein [Enterovibrio norvegicus]|uniref:hypothetical protein n=1 Tax=Enterovibrio norvegicus TaxID=188144 RepID=UPI0024B1B20F|nr:hypothetical protein [Enterovibrio norvegicus]